MEPAGVYPGSTNWQERNTNSQIVENSERMAKILLANHAILQADLDREMGELQEQIDKLKISNAELKAKRKAQKECIQGWEEAHQTTRRNIEDTRREKEARKSEIFHFSLSFFKYREGLKSQTEGTKKAGVVTGITTLGAIGGALPAVILGGLATLHQFIIPAFSSQNEKNKRFAEIKKNHPELTVYEATLKMEETYDREPAPLSSAATNGESS